MVSIVICTYNQEDLIEYTIQSAIAQTYEDIELIVSDDSSTDGTYERIMALKNKIENRFDNIQIIHHEKNMGLSKNLKNALAHAKGDWIKILYGDDILTPEAVAKCVQYANEHPEVSMLHSAYYICDEKGTYDSVISEPGEIFYPKQKEVTAKSLFNDYFIISPTVFIKREIYYQSLDDGIGIDDWGTYLEVALKYKIGYLDYPTVYFRMMSNSMSHFAADETGKKRLRKMMNNEFKVLDKYKNNPQLDGRQAIINCCNQAASLAIDSKFEDIFQEAREYAYNNGCDISKSIQFKHALAKIGLLRFVQGVKRVLGMETGCAR